MTETSFERRPMMEYAIPRNVVYSDTRRHAKNTAITLGVISLLLAALYGALFMFVPDWMQKTKVDPAVIDFIVKLLLGGTVAFGVWGFLYIAGGIMVHGYSRAWAVILIVIGLIHGAALGWTLYVQLMMQNQRNSQMVGIVFSALILALVLRLIFKCIGLLRENPQR